MSTPTAPVSQRALGRATLARQLLLRREPCSPVAAVTRLAGMQAQLARPPHIGLWSRLADYTRDALNAALHRRELVRATYLRGTLHLVSAADYLAHRAVLQPLLDRAIRSILKDRADRLDIPTLLADARRHLAVAPRTFEALRDLLSAGVPDSDERAMGFVVRCMIPLVQVPTDAPWGFPGAAEFAAAEPWLNQPLATDPDPRPLIRRYLAAYGPASVADAQTWTGLKSLRPVFEALRPELLSLRDERKRELFDLPGAPLPDPDTPAPPRFLPDFDSLVLAHDDRARLIDDAHRPAIYLSKNLRVLPTFLLDGRVAGTWSCERKKAAATLTLTPFAALTKPARSALDPEAHALLRFLEPDATTFDLRVSD